MLIVMLATSIIIREPKAFAGSADCYSVNNISNYNMHTNQVRGDNWSYFCKNGSMTDTTTDISTAVLCNQTGTNTNGYWYTDANGKTNTWYLTPDGNINTETKRMLAFNYTIGDKTAGMDLEITGTLTGDLLADLYILKTNDTVESVSDYGKGAVQYDTDWKSDIIESYTNLPGASEHSFTITIPADKAIKGNDISFWICRSGGSAYANNNLNVTIKALKYFDILSYSVQDESGNEVRTFNNMLNGLEISALVKNYLYRDLTPYLVVAIYDGENSGLLKTVLVAQNTEPMHNKDEETIHTSITKETLQSVGVKNGDYMKIFVWEDLSSIAPLDKYVYFPQEDDTLKKNVQDFAAVNGAQTNMDVVGLTWDRTDFSWQSAEPAKDNFDQTQLDKWGTMILNARKNGITILPVLDYTATWAADLSAYSCVDFGKTYTYGPAAVDTDAGDSCTRTVTVTNADGITGGPETRTYRLSRQRFDVEEWKKYVTKIVETYSAEPYNLKCFQVWNEAHPDSGFWYGGMDWYIENLHKTAAEIIRSYGCKVVYGGWPSCGSISQFFGLLDNHNAWDSVDVFDTHYFPLSTMDSVYNAALKRGIKSPGVWQTEVAWTSGTGYIPSNYPRMFYWALKHRSEQKGQFKTFFFTWGCPNDPNAYGYGKTLYYTDGTLTDHGRAMRTFLSLLQGDNVERYTAVTNNKNLTYQMSGNTIQAFEVDGKRVVASVCASDISAITGMTLDFKGIYGFKSIKFLDYRGDEITSMTPTVNGDGSISAAIPDDKLTPVGTSYYFYIFIDADSIIAPTNNIKDFELGSSSANNKSIIAPGRWSYLDGYYTPPSALSKGTGAGKFAATEWTVDNTKSEHAWYLDANGNIVTDTRPIIYNYTINKQQGGSDLIIGGTFNPNGSKKYLQILKTKEDNETVIGSDCEILYDQTVNTTTQFSIKVPASEVSVGNDIMFAVQTPADGTWSVVSNLDATIYVQQ